MMPLPVWLPGPMFVLGEGGLCPGGLYMETPQNQKSEWYASYWNALLLTIPPPPTLGQACTPQIVSLTHYVCGDQPVESRDSSSREDQACRQYLFKFSHEVQTICSVSIYRKLDNSYSCQNVLKL